MIIRLLALAGLATPLVALSAPGAMAQSTTEVLAPAAVVTVTAKIVVIRLWRNR